jgi:hypothetical protein
MGKYTGLPAINEVAFFLTERAPASTAALVQRGKPFADLLGTGVLGGEGAEQVDADALRAGLRIRAEILAEGLKSLVGESDAKAVIISRQLTSLRRLQFFATIVSAISASGAVGFAITDKHSETVVLSLLSLFSNAATIASSSLILGSQTKESDLIDLSRQLARSKSYAEITSKTLAAMITIEFNTDDLGSVLKDANLQFRELNEALAKSKR